MELSPPRVIIQHQTQDQASDPPNQVSNQSRRRNHNRPRTRAPPANASTSPDNPVAPQTDGSSTKPPQRDVSHGRRRGRQQGTSKPPEPSQTTGTSSVVDRTDAQHRPTRRNRLSKHPQGLSAEKEHQVAESVPAQPETKPQRPSRRSKFNASLSESTSLTGDLQTKPPAQASSKAKKVNSPRSRAPPADDLTSTLTRALSTPPYPDCPICFNAIRPEHHTWSCSPSDPSENLQCCWTMFHLKCIRA